MLASEKLDSLSNFASFAETLSEPLSPEELKELLNSLQTRLGDIPEEARFNDHSYCRNVLMRNPAIEVVLISWHSGQMTPIHNHKGSACAVKVISGKATEIAYSLSGSGSYIPSAVTHVEEGEVVASFDEDTHIMANFEEPGRDLVTLHCYSPPLSNMEIFSEEETYFAGYERLFGYVQARIALSAPAADPR